MSTKNRRIAAYLPQSVADSLAVFKEARGLEGDSQAVITILSEFLGVSQQVAHSVNAVEYATKTELEALSAKVAHLVEQVQNIDGFVERAISGAIDELSGESLSGEVKDTPGQLELLEESKPSDEDDSASDVSWISSKEAWELLQPPNCSYDAFRKYSVETLNQRYGLQADSSRRLKGKTKAKWLKMPNTVNIKSELLSESDSVIPEF